MTRTPFETIMFTLVAEDEDCGHFGCTLAKVEGIRSDGFKQATVKDLVTALRAYGQLEGDSRGEVRRAISELALEYGMFLYECEACQSPFPGHRRPEDCERVVFVSTNITEYEYESPGFEFQFVEEQ